MVFLTLPPFFFGNPLPPAAVPSPAGPWPGRRRAAGWRCPGGSAHGAAAAGWRCPGCSLYGSWMTPPTKWLIWGWINTYIIPFLVGWTSIYQLFWCSPGVQGFDTLPFMFNYRYLQFRFLTWPLIMIYHCFMGDLAVYDNGTPTKWWISLDVLLF